MKKIVIAVLLSSFIAAPAVAAGSFGINYSVDGAIGIQGESDISSMTDGAPVSVQAFLKSFSQKIGPDTWNTTGIGAAAIYDLNSVAKLDNKIHPYAGIGLMYVSYNLSGAGPAKTYFGIGSGLYLTGGVRYVVTPQVAADLNFNVLGDLTAGINISF